MNCEGGESVRPCGITLAIYCCRWPRECVGMMLDEISDPDVEYSSIPVCDKASLD
jgi:hypothetical protein